MGRNPFLSGGGQFMEYRSTKRFVYPPYKHKTLNNRRSLLASVSGRKAAMNNIINSTAIYDDEKLIVEEIKNKLDELHKKIKENDENKNQEPILRFKGTGTSFKSV